MTIRDALLPVVDRLRGIPGAAGLRPFTVSVFVREWSGSRVGLSTASDVNTPLKVCLGTFETKVRAITTREVIASGSVYDLQDLRVGPITPTFPGSGADGNSFSVFDPSATDTPTELFFKIVGPGYPTEGGWFKKVSQDTIRPFRFMFVVRKTGEIP